MHRFDWKVVPFSSYAETTGKCARLDGMPWDHVPLDKDPRTVWASPHALQRLLDFADAHSDRSRADRMVVFSGSEMPLSAAFGWSDSERNASVAKLRRYFSRISFQTKDIGLEHVHLAPMGLCWGYITYFLLNLNKAGLGYASFFRAISGTHRVPKSRNVLAAWGTAAGWLDWNSTFERATRQLPTRRLFQPSNSSNLAIIVAHLARRNLRRWLDTPAASAAGVDFRELGPVEWWEELPKYRFLLAAPGSAIQTAKIFEALLALTVPIAQHVAFDTFYELEARGFPIAVVDRWSEVTPANLSRWWASLSPRLESFRRNCLRAEAYWLMYTGALERCE